MGIQQAIDLKLVNDAIGFVGAPGAASNTSRSESRRRNLYALCN